MEKELARKTVALIEKYNMENDCVITSFSSSALSAKQNHVMKILESDIYYQRRMAIIMI